MADLAKSKPAQRLVAAQRHSGAGMPAICGEARCGAAGQSGICRVRLGVARARGAGVLGGGREARNANGAGIAADPTLTSAWTPLARDASGEPSASLAPGYAWRPMSSLSHALPCGRPCQRFVTGARAGIRLSLLPCCALSKPEVSDVRCLAQSLGRDPVPFPIRACGGSGLASFPNTRSGQIHGLSGGCSVAPASSSWLAFGQGLLHAVSRQARGQLPPPSLGSKLR